MTAQAAAENFVIDGLQYCRWSPQIFADFRAGGVDAVHVTVAYHEGFREAAANMAQWRAFARDHGDVITIAGNGDEVRRAKAAGKTAIVFGFQNPSPIQDDLGLIEACHLLGARFMQLSYNRQSLLAGGWQEPRDSGISTFGKEAIAEMNRVGMVVDMSHSGERSTIEAAELSARPIAITHANPAWWRKTARNKTDAAMAAVAQSGGMIGFSLYPLHLAGGGACKIEDFCAMIGKTAEKHGAHCLGIGSDLCQGRQPADLRWMRLGRRASRAADPPAEEFPPPPPWFADNRRGFANLAAGLAQAGFGGQDIAGIMGNNWLRFFDRSFAPAAGAPAA